MIQKKKTKDETRGSTHTGGDKTAIRPFRVSFPDLTEIDGLDIHFIHVRSRHGNALPLIVTHGWPGSVTEQMKIIDPLTNPTAHGGNASDAYHVVIPAMPGYGFSGRPATIGWNSAHIARAWVVLMKRLGYEKFVAQGGDWGASFFAVKGVTVPAAVSVFPDELYAAPRSWAERAYPKLIHYNKLPKGGHFAAWEQPQLLSEEVCAGFRSLRKSALEGAAWQSTARSSLTDGTAAGLCRALQMKLSCLTIRSSTPTAPIRAAGRSPPATRRSTFGEWQAVEIAAVRHERDDHEDHSNWRYWTHRIEACQEASSAWAGSSGRVARYRRQQRHR